MPSPESKQNFALVRDRILAESGKDYWRSVEEFADTPEFEEFVKREYPVHGEEWNDPVTRRSFLKVMGATLAFAGLSGCVIQPAEKIVPYVRPNEDMLPGKPLFFATAMSVGGIATGLLAKSFEARPIKLEGNPEHPGSLGATDVLAQASLLDMYDPDRSQEVTYRGTPKTWQNFTTALRTAVIENGKDGGAGVRILTETVTSPTLQAQIKQLTTELPNAKWVQFEPVNNDNAIAGAKLAFGSAAHTVYKFDKAERVLSLDADIFSGFNPRYIGDAIKTRALSEGKKEISRMYVVETTTTLMGSKADHRLAVKPSQVPEIAKAVSKALGVAGANTSYTENAAWIAAMAKDLNEHKGKSLVVAGDHQPPVVHALAHAMNAALGNVGQTVVYTEPLTPSDKTQIEQLRELVGDIDAGRVKMLVVLGGNPVYKTPVDLKLNKERMDKIALRVHLGMHVDETAELCHWHVSEKHYLEMWSDARAYDGTVSIVQPLIQPIYDSKSAHELLQLFFRENYDKKDYDIVKEFWKGKGTSISDGDFEMNWRKAVHNGVVPNTSISSESAGFTTAIPQKSVIVNSAFLSQPETKPASSGPLEISILPDPSIYDGRFSNNGWLQELPNPLTKITWDNVALVSPNTAARLELNRGNDPDEISGGERKKAFINSRGSNMAADLVWLTYQGSKIEKPVPVWISPGQPDDVVTIYMGYGRMRAGRIGTGLGYSAFDVQRSDAMSFGSGDIKPTGEKATIATTQIHFNMEGRDILRVFDADVFEANQNLGHQEDFYAKSMYKTASDDVYQKQYAVNNKWGMTIDLNACVGCNACVLACQSENNIPVVGKEQVERNREMQWMRIDTYFTGGDVNHPEGLHFQPVICQQCEQAPCEVVCPVTATVHNPEGLNDMVYNRCVGTRYCSNNCPYKVRRFNFLLYQDWDTPQYKLMRNPEVSIRSRGVMEKCTYCVQRIAAARIEAQKDVRAIIDGEIVTACQSACPTGAIIFGDMNDPLSKVAKSKKDHRNYNLLNELNTQPRTTYLAGLKNQNKEMPDYKPLKIPESHGVEKKEGEKKAGGSGH